MCGLRSVEHYSFKIFLVGYNVIDDSVVCEAYRKHGRFISHFPPLRLHYMRLIHLTPATNVHQYTDFCYMESSRIAV